MPKPHLRIFVLNLMLAAMLSACSLSPTVSGWSSDGYKVIDVTPQVVSELRQQRLSPIGPSGEVPSGNYSYHIGAGDVLYAKIYTPSVQSFDGSNHTISDNWQEYNRVLVTDDGRATFPYVGDIYLQDMTIVEAKQALNDALSEYFKNPRAVLEVKESYNSKIFVMGEVNKPGIVSMKAGEMNVMEALSASDGANPATADYDNIYIIRGALDVPKLEPASGEQHATLTGKTPIPLETADKGEYLVLNEIDAAPPVQVEKIKPEPIKITEVPKEEKSPEIANKTSAYLALESASGSPKKPNPLQTSIFNIDGSSGRGLAIAAQFPLQPNDVVYISPLGITEWARIITQIIPMNAAYLVRDNTNR